jgi:DNA-binding beta-propeller fold protein YncE
VPPARFADPAALERATRDARSRYDAHDDRGAIAGYQRVLAINPGDDQALYFSAVAALRAGDPAAALRRLQELADTGSDLVPTADDFPALAREPAFAAIAGRVAASAARHRQAREAFRIAEPGLLAEGIAYDPVERAFYVGSATRRKIVKIAEGGAAVDFVRPQPELDAIGGLRVDPARRRLWAVTGTFPRMDGFVAGEPERNVLIEVDLTTGALIGRYPLEEAGGHSLNDVALDAHGRPFVTDTESGQLYTLPDGARSLVAVFATPPYFRPNGIAFDDRGEQLFVADGTGVYRADPAARTTTRLGQPVGTSLGIFDGMYFVRDPAGARLIGIQALAGPGRIVAARLTPALDAVTQVDVLESAHPSFDAPTTGAVVGSWLYVIANSQLWFPRPPHETIVVKLPVAGLPTAARGL